MNPIEKPYPRKAIFFVGTSHVPAIDSAGLKMLMSCFVVVCWSMFAGCVARPAGNESAVPGLSVLTEEKIATIGKYTLLMQKVGTANSRMVDKLVFVQIRADDGGQPEVMSIFRDRGTGVLAHCHWETDGAQCQVHITRKNIDPRTDEVSVVKYCYVWSPPSFELGPHMFTTKAPTIIR